MLHANVHAFFDVTVPNNLVDNDTHGVRGYIVNNSGPSVVELVGHPLLLCCIGLDVDDIPNTIGNQVCREFDRAMLFEAPLEHMARARPITEGVRHFE